MRHTHKHKFVQPKMRSTNLFLQQVAPVRVVDRWQSYRIDHRSSLLLGWARKAISTRGYNRSYTIIDHY